MPDAVGGKDQKKQRNSGGTQEACSKQRTNVAQPFFSSLWSSVVKCVWRCTCESVSAAGMWQQPQGLVCPGTSNWGDWDPGAEYLSLAAGGTHTVHVSVPISH